VTWYPATALVAGAVGLVAGALVPRVIARLPEPDPVPADEPELVPADDEAHFARPVDEPKELYRDLAALTGLRWKLAAACAVAAGLLGARVGWDPALLFLLYLVPVCVALSVVDWRTRYLPSRLIVPSYLVVGALVLLAALLLRDPGVLATAAIGWLGAFTFYFVLWFVNPRAMAYGDVRLAGLLGMALGAVGIAHLVLGVFTGFVLLGLGGLLLSLLRVFHRKHMPFGPFMVGGAWLAVIIPLQLATAYGWVELTLVSAIGRVVGAF
jgi:leader peptidase (prepilin peptidase) / N-methyltransferase